MWKIFSLGHILSTAGDALNPTYHRPAPPSCPRLHIFCCPGSAVLIFPSTFAVAAIASFTHCACLACCIRHSYLFRLLRVYARVRVLFVAPFILVSPSKLRTLCSIFVNHWLLLLHDQFLNIVCRSLDFECPYYSRHGRDRDVMHTETPAKVWYLCINYCRVMWTPVYKHFLA
jgi:hypothetical protein